VARQPEHLPSWSNRAYSPPTVPPPPARGRPPLAAIPGARLAGFLALLPTPTGGRVRPKVSPLDSAPFPAFVDAPAPRRRQLVGPVLSTGWVGVGVFFRPPGRSVLNGPSSGGGEGSRFLLVAFPPALFTPPACNIDRPLCGCGCNTMSDPTDQLELEADTESFQLLTPPPRAGCGGGGGG